jgi:hypothetical protein
MKLAALTLVSTLCFYCRYFDENGVADIGHNIYSNLGAVRWLFPINLINQIDPP